MMQVVLGGTGSTAWGNGLEEKRYYYYYGDTGY